MDRIDSRQFPYHESVLDGQISRFWRVSFILAMYYYTIYSVKFNSERAIVQFIFAQCLVYSFEQKLSLDKKVENQIKGMTVPMKKMIS